MFYTDRWFVHCVQHALPKFLWDLLSQIIGEKENVWRFMTSLSLSLKVHPQIYQRVIQETEEIYCRQHCWLGNLAFTVWLARIFFFLCGLYSSSYDNIRIKTCFSYKIKLQLNSPVKCSTSHRWAWSNQFSMNWNHLLHESVPFIWCL